jgi:hypothetical protein
MLRVGFEPTIPVVECAKTVHALDRGVTVIAESIPPLQCLITFYSFHLLINGSTALCRALASFAVLLIQTVGFLGRVINLPQGCYLHRGEHNTE